MALTVFVSAKQIRKCKLLRVKRRARDKPLPNLLWITHAYVVGLYWPPCFKIPFFIKTKLGPDLLVYAPRYGAHDPLDFGIGIGTFSSVGPLRLIVGVKVGAFFLLLLFTETQKDKVLLLVDECITSACHVCCFVVGCFAQFRGLKWDRILSSVREGNRVLESSRFPARDRNSMLKGRIKKGGRSLGRNFGSLNADFRIRAWEDQELKMEAVSLYSPVWWLVQLEKWLCHQRKRNLANDSRQKKSYLGNIWWEARLEDIFSGRPFDMLDAALSDTVSRFPVDIQPFRDVVEEVRPWTCGNPDAQQPDELYLYCYYVAGTVGLMSVPIMGIAPESKATTESVYNAALALGMPNQLTNILRDVEERCKKEESILTSR
ncbi:hypothetical protein HAX54_016984 [Datura stramonium]|uniref:15-cis-phytoene synthase n=1 Tax=Datura stramonium TaxID=4076 RepID=A0ABS8ULH7_DATST|nr:hypothetical protein [Datura stramonium]